MVNLFNPSNLLQHLRQLAMTTLSMTWWTDGCWLYVPYGVNMLNVKWRMRAG